MNKQSLSYIKLHFLTVLIVSSPQRVGYSRGVRGQRDVMNSDDVRTTSNGGDERCHGSGVSLARFGPSRYLTEKTFARRTHEHRGVHERSA